MQYQVHESLVVIKVNGYESSALSLLIDVQGDANWLCDQYGMNHELQSPGILWTDYDDHTSDRPWEFSVLLNGKEFKEFQQKAKEWGYEIVEATEVEEVGNFGDGVGGTVEVLRHRDGWVLLPTTAITQK